MPCVLVARWARHSDGSSLFQRQASLAALGPYFTMCRMYMCVLKRSFTVSRITQGGVSVTCPRDSPRRPFTLRAGDLLVEYLSEYLSVFLDRRAAQRHHPEDLKNMFSCWRLSSTYHWCDIYTYASFAELLSSLRPWPACFPVTLPKRLVFISLEVRHFQRSSMCADAWYFPFHIKSSMKSELHIDVPRLSPPWR